MRIFVLEFRAGHDRYEWHEHVFERNRTCANRNVNTTSSASDTSGTMDLDQDTEEESEWGTVSSDQAFHDFFRQGKEPHLVGSFTFDDLVTMVSTPWVLLGVTFSKLLVTQV